MTTWLSKEQLRQPDWLTYKECLINKSIPISHRKRVLETYRRQARRPDLYMTRDEYDLYKLCTPAEPTPLERKKRIANDLQIQEHFKETKKARGKKEKKARKRYQAKVEKNKPSPHNVRVRSGLMVVFGWGSKGKKRPSKKAKITFKRVKTTIHLKGNKYGGGYRL